MGTISIRLPGALERRLAALADQEGTGKSALAREAIEAFLERRERERHMAALVAEVRLQDRDEAIRLAEEGLTVGNEALAMAEHPASRERE